jgi:flagellar hook-associated protein 1 FlgK
MSGLRAAGRTSETISANIANAMNPAYGVRQVALSASQFGGVSVDGVVRNVDPAIVADKRLADAAFTNATEVSDFLNRLEKLIGTPDEPDSLSARIADLESSLVTAASRPDAPERLNGVVNAAKDLATLLNTASDGLQRARSDADRKIGVQVERLNTALQGVDELNDQITKTILVGGDPSALYDNRQALVDEISQLVPVRQIERDNGRIALYSTGGAILLDSSPAEIEFSAVNQVTAYMTLGGGQLSGLTIDGIAVRTDSERGALSGGSIAANFEVRDEIGERAQSQLDAFARDVIERFQNAAVDPTIPVGSAGLFVDTPQTVTANPPFPDAFDPANEVGIASRMEIHADVDELRGGDAWRIRDGIYALAQGDVGDARNIRRLSDALSDTRTPASGDFGAGAFSTINLVSSMTSQFGAERARAEQTLSFTSAKFDEIKQLLLSEGVDTDQELQRLILVEQTYAANARMIEAADEMLQTILRI